MSLMRILGGALAALALNVTVAAADDTSVITGCLRQASEAGTDARACVGRVSSPCMQTPEGQSTQGTVACAQRETQIWDALLNEAYSKLLTSLNSEAAEDVRKAQRIWLTLRDADCRVPYYFYEGGTIVQVLGASCLLDHTADRAILIRSWRDMAAG
jgi:uncharacterized protein YecT (DUF1311 family)